MAAKKKEYQRLSGTGTNVASRSKLWLGSDHLLAVTSTGYWENYKRFYFRDIQAFVIRPNRRGRIVNIVLAVLAFLPFMGAMSIVLGNTPDYGLTVFWGIISGIPLSCLAVNTVRGPTCMVHVKTAVQMEELPSLRRVRRAHKLLNYLQPLLVEAQGELSGAEIASRMAPEPQGAPAPVNVTAAPALAEPVEPPPPAAS